MSNPISHYGCQSGSLITIQPEILITIQLLGLFAIVLAGVLYFRGCGKTHNKGRKRRHIIRDYVVPRSSCDYFSSGTGSAATSDYVVPRTRSKVTGDYFEKLNNMPESDDKDLVRKASGMYIMRNGKAWDIPMESCFMSSVLQWYLDAGVYTMYPYKKLTPEQLERLAKLIERMT